MLTFKRAFTLVELLVVITIIGILAAMVVQNFRETKLKAQGANIKTSVRNYRQAMELHYAQNKSYFVKMPSGCNLATRVTSGGYSVQGNGAAGCVGFNGSGEGQMTRRFSTDLPSYKPDSIADALVKEGVLSTVYTYPGVTSFTSNDKLPTSGGGQAPKDFVLTVCDGSGREAQTPETATNFAIFAQPIKTPTTTSSDVTRANQLCGAYPYGWNVLEAND